MSTELTRRATLAAGLAALLPRAAHGRPPSASPSTAPSPPDPADAAAPSALHVQELRVKDTGGGADRFTLCVPEDLMEGDARFVGIAVLLHGLGETTDARAGLRAWLDAYGLRTAHERLKRPPVKRTSKRKDWSDERVQHVNRTLSVTPYRGFAAVCPYLPNLYRKDQPLEKLAKYADWIVDTVVPRAREVLGGRAIGGHLALCGCSFGGWVGLDVLLRRPGAFDAFVGVQSALYDTGAKAYAERLANAFRGARPLPIRMTTSTQDPFRSGNEALVAQCRKLGLEAELLLLPGPHDQGWLREGGTLETMIWLDRVLNGMPDAAP